MTAIAASCASRTAAASCARAGRTTGPHGSAAIAAHAAGLPVRAALIDGEAVVLGRARGEQLRVCCARRWRMAATALSATRSTSCSSTASTCAQRPLVERKQRLAALLQGSELIRYSDHLAGGGRGPAGACLPARGRGADRQARGPALPLRPQHRWLKIKCEAREEVVIGGFTPLRGRRDGLGALVVGHRETAGCTMPAGSAPAGTSRTPERLLAALQPLRRPTMPFDQVPPLMRRRVQWVEPRAGGGGPLSGADT